MARYLASVDSPRPADDLFTYLSDFSNAQEWDPGVVEARKLGDGPVGEGTEFLLVTELRGRRTPLTYRVVACDPPRLVTFRAENATLVSLDTITFAPRDGGGTRVTYDADLRLKGLLRLGDPVLKLVFGRIGDRALAGLRAQLGASTM